MCYYDIVEIKGRGQRPSLFSYAGKEGRCMDEPRTADTGQGNDQGYI